MYTMPCKQTCGQPHRSALSGSSPTAALMHFVADDGWRPERPPGPKHESNESPRDVIITLGLTYHLHRNPTCCIKHYHPGARRLSPPNVHASTSNRQKQRCATRPVTFFFFSLSFFHFLLLLIISCFSSVGPKPIAAMGSIKKRNLSSASSCEEPRKSYDTQSAGTK